MSELEDRLYQHFKKYNTAHSLRAKRVGKNADLEWADLLAVTREFRFLCAFCDRPLADIIEMGELHFNHFNNIRQTGHVITGVVFSCQHCNHVLRAKYHDNADEYLKSLGKDSWEFYRKIFNALDRRIEELIEELNQPTLLESIFQKTLVEHFGNR